jgi:hypothetical protein
MNYKFDFTQLRAMEKEGKRYALVRAIANGSDSYASIFTENARERLISQIKSNGVKVHALHTEAINDNLSIYLDSRMQESANPVEKDKIKELKAQLSNRVFPIGKAIEASFVDDNTVEALIEENVILGEMGLDYKKYLDGAWKMIEDKILTGVSLVFNNVKTFRADGKEFIDDLNVLGLDFVDRPAHTDTRVLEVFTRAMADVREEVVEGKKMTEIVDVDKIAEVAAQKMRVQEEVKLKQEQELKLKEDLIRAEYEQKIKALNEEKVAIEKDLQEAVTIAKEAVSKSSEISKAIRVDNPHAKRIENNVDNDNKFANMKLADLLRLQAGK